jgi:hypothetical protein
VPTNKWVLKTGQLSKVVKRTNGFWQEVKPHMNFPAVSVMPTKSCPRVRKNLW